MREALRMEKTDKTLAEMQATGVTVPVDRSRSLESEKRVL